jgi:hypothetical protein
MRFRAKARSFGVARTSWGFRIAFVITLCLAIAESVATQGMSSYLFSILAAVWVWRALGRGSTSKIVEFEVPSPESRIEQGRTSDRGVRTVHGEPVVLHPEHGLLIVDPAVRDTMPASVWLTPRRVSIRLGGRLFSLPGLRIALPAAVVLDRIAPLVLMAGAFGFGSGAGPGGWIGWDAVSLMSVLMAAPLWLLLGGLGLGSLGQPITFGRDGMLIGRLRRRFIRWADIADVRIEPTWLSIFAERVVLVLSNGKHIVLAAPPAFGFALKSLIESLRETTASAAAPAAKATAVPRPLEGEGYRETGTTVEAALEQLQNPGLPARDRVRIATQLHAAGEPIQPMLDAVSEHDCDPELLAEIEALKASVPRRVA